MSSEPEQQEEIIEAPAEDVRPAQTQAAPAPSAPPAEERCPIEQLGGMEGIYSLAEQLSEKLVSDPRVNYYLFGLNRTDLTDTHICLLITALKGEAAGQGSDLHKAFSRFFEKGLKDRHFDVVINHLRDSLAQLDIADELTDTVLEATGRARQALFGR